LRFFDASFDGDTRRDTRIGVGLDRYRRVAKEDQMFVVEVVHTKRLVAEVDGLYPEEASAKEAVALLYLASKAVFALGGGRSRGLGHVALEAFEATVDGTTQDMDSIMGNAMEILG
jgi:CRISPR/Cas system CSM-associated protein Csm3 (group 7 of RAMP superfamily)